MKALECHAAINLFFCLEERKVLVSGQEIRLTAREFNAFQLLITNHRQVMTFEMIIDLQDSRASLEKRAGRRVTQRRYKEYRFLEDR